MKPEPPVSVYARLNAKIMPIARGERYEDPLSESLEKSRLGEVVGGGTMGGGSCEIEYCGIDLDLVDLEKSVPFVCDVLAALGAPRGSRLEYEREGERIEVPFGFLEGLAIYLNGTDLPAEVYAKADVNLLCDELSRMLGDRGEIQGHWRGPAETALYLYGYSSDEMIALLASHLAATPLCERARLVKIA